MFAIFTFGKEIKLTMLCKPPSTNLRKQYRFNKINAKEYSRIDRLNESTYELKNNLSFTIDMYDA